MVLALWSEKVSHLFLYCTFSVSFNVFVRYFSSRNELLILCAYYGRPAPMTLVFRQSSIVMRPSSLGGAAYCVALCLSVCPSVPLSLTSVTWRHLANYNDTHVLLGTHIVRPSRPHKLVSYILYNYYSTTELALVLEEEEISDLLPAPVNSAV